MFRDQEENCHNRKADKVSGAGFSDLLKVKGLQVGAGGQAGGFREQALKSKNTRQGTLVIMSR